MTNYTNTYTYTSACRTQGQNKDERHRSLEKYTSHFIERVVCERELETEQNCNILTPTIIAISVSFLFSWAVQPGTWGPASLGASFLYRILSPTGLISNWLIGGLRAPSDGCWLSLPHLVSNWSGLQTAQSGVPRAPSAGCCFLYSIISPTLWSPNSLNFLCTELYNSSTPTQSLPITGHRNMHFCRLWNGMFDRHQAEITVMQFTGHSLPVHQFVTVPWDFNPDPYCQSSSPMPMEYATSTIFGMACLAGSEVNIQHIYIYIYIYIYTHIYSVGLSSNSIF